MWLIYDPITEEVLARGFSDNWQAAVWVADQIKQGLLDPDRHVIACEEVAGSNE